MDKPLNVNRLRTHFSLIKLIAWTCIFLGLILFFSLHYPHSSPSNRLKYLEDSDWKNQIQNSGRPKSRNGFRVLVTGAAGFVGMHVSTALRQRGDGVVGLDNFNGYYEKSLKRARENLLKSQRDILKGKQVSVFEGLNGFTVSRDFTYIDDIVKGCLGALDTATKSTGSGGVKKGPAQLRVYNLGNTSPVPVSKLVNILEKLLKVKANKVVSPMPANGDVLFTHANISLASRELGYKPTTDLQSGLKKFVAWYLDYYKPSGKKNSA
ncbi:hypothetical protein OIU76_000139 [Salix suchowensis]|nr:hypothetical protein OIU76_000139 [Salix suchowensis]